MTTPCKLLTGWTLAAAVWAALAQEQPNPAFAPIEDTPGLPRVLLIGDSISIGYTLDVRELLKGQANVHRIPANAATTRVGLKSIDAWLGEKPWDVIHFNWGLHDLRIEADGRRQVPLEEYAKNLETLVARLDKTRAALIWASTTPVPSERVKPPRRPADVPQYNTVAQEIMKRHAVPINDLYQAVLPRLAEFQMPDNVHFKPEGSRFLAERVAAAIRRALPSR
jgi:acyl-CoA thioesterase-1